MALDGYYFCGACPNCERHEVQLCRQWGHIGLSAPGGLAELMTVPARMAIPSTADVASDELALSEPFAVAVRALRRSRVMRGERVGILGGGTIGLAVLQAATAAGAEVSLLERDATRRQVAAQLGADVVADPVALPGGLDLVVECTGVADVAAAGIHALRPGGRLVAVGIPLATVNMDLRRIVLDELTVLGSIGHVYDEDFAEAVRLICEGKVDAGILISHRLSLAEAATRAFSLLSRPGAEPVLKVLVSPAGLQPAL